MKKNSKKYRKQMIEVIGSAYEFILKLGTTACYRGNLKDRAFNHRERWSITEISESGKSEQSVMTHRFDFSVNEEADLRRVTELFIEKLGVKDYSLDINFKYMR